MPLRVHRRLVALALAALTTAGLLGACTGEGTGTGGSTAGAVVVTASDTECVPATTSLSAGVVTLRIENRGSRDNELYLLRADGSVVGERGVGPGASAELAVDVTPGPHVVRCKPGRAGDGISVPVVVGGAVAATTARDPRLDAAVTAYRGYVAEQARDSLAGARRLAAAIDAGDAARARSLYAASRVGWERIEPVAESFGDLDPRIDMREADLEQGQRWGGWHALEKQLWVGAAASGDTRDAEPVAARLVADLGELVARVPTAEITPTSMANGAKELLDEVAATKVTGEEEAFSHTDLVDVQANVTGARRVLTLLEPVLTERDAELRTLLTTRFEALQAVLDRHRTGTGDTAFRTYTDVTGQQRRELSEAVDAVAEPLSRLTPAVLR